MIVLLPVLFLLSMIVIGYLNLLYLRCKRVTAYQEMEQAINDRVLEIGYLLLPVLEETLNVTTELIDKWGIGYNGHS